MQPYEFRADYWDTWEYLRDPLGAGSYGSVIKVRKIKEPGVVRAVKLIGPKVPGEKLRAELDMSCKLKKHNPDLMTYESVIWVPMPSGIQLPPGAFLKSSRVSSSSESESSQLSPDVLEIPIMGKSNGNELSSSSSSSEEYTSESGTYEPSSSDEESPAAASDSLYSSQHTEEKTYGLVVDLVESGDLQTFVEDRFDRYYHQILADNAAHGIKEDLDRDGHRLLQLYADDRDSPGGQRFILGAIISLARQLECIHEAGYEHRDLKPDNILYDSATGRFRIIDFGLSTLVGRHPGHRGTRGYIAPELNDIIGQMGDLRPADIWSLGATLVYLYAGREFIDAEDMTPGPSPVNYKLTEEGVQRVMDGFNADDVESERIMLGMLNMDPDRRWTLHRVLDTATRALTAPFRIGLRGGGGRRGRGNPTPRFFARGPRRYYAGPRTVMRPRSRWLGRGGFHPAWFAGLLPLWAANAVVYSDPSYHTYPITVDYGNELAIRAELARLRAENAVLSQSNEYALVPDLEKGRYIWVRNPAY